MKTYGAIAVAMTLTALPAAPTYADPGRDAILAGLAAEAEAGNSAFAGFSAERGKTLFFTIHGGGKPTTPACTSCHGENPQAPGETRAGKAIDPIAVSKTPVRFTDAKKVAKWFRRNCKTVLGRECTPVEKGDFITFMMDQ